MKITFIMMAAALFMAACSSNNDDPATNPAQEIAGTYTGYSVAEHKYISIPVTTPGEKITIAANENGTCDISFPSGSGYGTFTISGAAVSAKGNTYSISGEGKTVMGMTAESQKEYACTVEGTISSDKKTVSVVLTCPTVMGGLTVEFIAGEAPVNMIIAGVYNGALAVTVLGNDVAVTGGDKVIIKSIDDGKVELTLAGFEAMLPLNDIVISEIEVSAENTTYTLSGDVDTQAGDYRVAGTFEGTVKDGEAVIVFTLRPGAMPFDIVAAFTGSKQEK